MPRPTHETRYTYDADLTTALQFMGFAEVRSGVFESGCAEETVTELRSVGTDRALTLRSPFQYSFYERRYKGRVLLDRRRDAVGALLLEFYGPMEGEVLAHPMSLWVPTPT